MEKKELNKTAIFCIKTLKELELISDWNKGASIYFKLTNEEITPSSLSRKASEVLVTKDVDTQLLKEYFLTSKSLITAPTEKVKEVDELKEKSTKLPAAVMNAFAIKKDDLKEKFGVDLDVDTDDVINYKIRQKIANKSFILQYMNYDPGLFDIIYEIGYWTTPIKRKQIDGTDAIEVILNNKAGIKIVERKVPFHHYTKEEYGKYLDDYLNERGLTMFDLFDQKVKTTTTTNPDLAVVCPGLEIHLGKQGAASDHEDYSTKHAMARIRMVARAILKYQQYVRASKLILGVGNDYLNTDTIMEKTGADTPQKNDTRPKELAMWGKIGYVGLINALKDEFDRIVLKYNPGNHDELSSWQLYLQLYDKYAEVIGEKKVEVGMAFEDMRFTTGYMHGDYLLVFSHGKSSESKPLSNSAIIAMAIESFPAEYARAKHMYVFTGHMHTDTEEVHDKLHSTILRTASLSGHGSWDATSGYTTSRQGHTVYLIDEKLGYIGKERVTLSEEDKYEKIASVKRKPKIDMYKQMVTAFNLSNKVAKLEILNKKQSLVDNRLLNEASRIIMSAKKALEAVDINFDELDEERRQTILEQFGYDIAIAPIEKEKQKIKELIIKQEKRA